MVAEPRNLARMHAVAVNGRDVETLLAIYPRHARLVADGRVVGQGPQDVGAFVAEQFPENAILQDLDIPGRAVLVEWVGAEGHREPVAILEVDSREGLVTEARLVHDAGRARRLVEGAGRPA